MTTKRYRCAGCDAAVELVETYLAYERGRHELPLHLRLTGDLDTRLHSRFRSEVAPHGAIGTRLTEVACGPVETYEVDPYVEQLERLIGETIV